jgi:hypothetical protein
VHDTTTAPKQKFTWRIVFLRIQSSFPNTAPL